MKTVIFVGDSRDRIRDFPEEVRSAMGIQLLRVQMGAEPLDWKPMKGIGSGVREIRIHVNGEYRTLYVANKGDAIYVLHAFQKKTQKTSRKDIELARKRFKLIGGENE